MVTTETNPHVSDVLFVEKSILKKMCGTSIEKLQSLVLPRIAATPLFSNFCSIICQVVTYGGVKNKLKRISNC